ncbi:uncharacterized protein ACLA_093790 [Aspergillus clavatus NRRL 1]|uniref:Fatty acid desaturase domain-containing protein n=1 Tax=Aspergillus clavatus (strain ATCC 1007 / CBS 513.65 / DSM 816 / NCTC 3887 / NRRL 1 / QM 1276 / 107) TaxID=344612 RepID=A1CFN1_ASPCL|nr:uncharacterized protein ACLA_093790 [Aspergillus clavatus NRRL 1]EAW11680.1 conserved hypothetical protein [Aspergillus clavatus NRRL 1]
MYYRDVASSSTNALKIDNMDLPTNIDPYLTLPDQLVLRELLKEGTGTNNRSTSETIQALQSLNNPNHAAFDPTVFQFWETHQLRTRLPSFIQNDILNPYINWAKRVARFPTDVVMVTHLLIYMTISVPSAIWLHYYHFTWGHGLLHWILHVWYAGTYTLMKHQYVHMNGVLAPQYRLVDRLFPYIVDPLVGHTWNSYYYHHVKHHHVEGNGPGDLNSTMWYDRDSVADFARYVARFFFLIWLDLPLYFLRKGKSTFAMKTALWESSNYLFIYAMWRYVHPQAAFCVFVLPLLTLRLGLMAGNWGQHAFVDPKDPASDFRSSVTLIDVASNRFCFNDGYHTSHHLHPRRHWREHPVALLRDKARYANENALVFCNIDYLMLTVKLLQKDYEHLAKCMVPIGPAQCAMSLQERAEMLRTRTRRFPATCMKEISRRK